MGLPAGKGVPVLRLTEEQERPGALQAEGKARAKACRSGERHLGQGGGAVRPEASRVAGSRQASDVDGALEVAGEQCDASHMLTENINTSLTLQPDNSPRRRSPLYPCSIAEDTEGHTVSKGAAGTPPCLPTPVGALASQGHR